MPSKKITAKEANDRADEINGRISARDHRFRKAALMIDIEGSVFFIQSAFIADLGGGYKAIISEHHKPILYHKDECVLEREFSEVVSEKETRLTVKTRRKKC